MEQKKCIKKTRMSKSICYFCNFVSVKTTNIEMNIIIFKTKKIKQKNKKKNKKNIWAVAHNPQITAYIQKLSTSDITMETKRQNK